MENEELVLGKIGAVGGGICKTYPESIIRMFEKEDRYIIRSALLNYSSRREKIYLDIETNDIVLDCHRNEDGEYKELVLLSIYPIITGSNNHGYGEVIEEYFVEVIEKDVLYRHLKEEKERIESTKEKQLILNK